MFRIISLRDVLLIKPPRKIAENEYHGSKDLTENC